jgi:hypothetical protein
MQKLKLKVANTGSNTKGHKGKSLKKASLEQNVDDNDYFCAIFKKLRFSIINLRMKNF